MNLQLKMVVSPLSTRVPQIYMSAVHPTCTTNHPGYGYPDYEKGSGTQFHAPEKYVPQYVRGLEPSYERTRDFSSPYTEDDDDTSGEDDAYRMRHSSKEPIGRRCQQPPVPAETWGAND